MTIDIGINNLFSWRGEDFMKEQLNKIWEEKPTWADGIIKDEKGNFFWISRKSSLMQLIGEIEDL